MLAYIPGPELLDITAGDMIFVSFWALASLLIWVALVGVPVFGPIVLIALLVIWFARRSRRLHR